MPPGAAAAGHCSWILRYTGKHDARCDTIPDSVIEEGRGAIISIVDDRDRPEMKVSAGRAARLQIGAPFRGRLLSVHPAWRGAGRHMDATY